MRILGTGASLRTEVGVARTEGRSVRIVMGGIDKHSVMVAFAEGLGLPGWFGRNLDALADALRELGDPGQQVELFWDGVEHLRTLDPRLYAAMLGLLEHAESERDDLHVTVLVR
jgi:RNAse (barnase) inhibitor barstar